jgi:thiol-disulfide isomerase/thioredoxin
MRIINVHHRKNQMATIGLLPRLLFIGIIVHGLSGCTDNKLNYPKVGGIFPFSVFNQLKQVDEKKIDLKNKVLLINFWATWCTPCRKEMPDLQNLSATLDQNQFAVIGISVDDDINLVREFLLQYKIQFANFQDENRKIATQIFGIKAFPETFVVSPTGIIIRRITGEQIWDENVFKNLLDGMPQVGLISAEGWTFG